MDEELVEMGSHWLRILTETKDKLWEVFEEQNLDAAFFDVDISLKIEVDGQMILIRDGWDKLEEY